MGEIADMMLDGTMDFETGEWNFDGEDGPGFPMTGAEAAEWRRSMGQARGPKAPYDGTYSAYKLTKAWRKKLAQFGEIHQHDAYHWSIRKDKAVLADWWPHKRKWRIAGTIQQGGERAFVLALAKATGASQ